MFKDVTIGQYIPGDSLIHRLDPRVKIIFTIAYIVGVFLVDHFFVYGLFALIIGLVLANTKISPMIILRGLKPLIFILVLTAILNLFMTPGEILLDFKFVTITREGVRLALFMVFRLVFLVVGSSLLTLTTSAKGLTDGLDSLLSPLTKLGFPTEQLTMMMTIALRFIPTLFEETDKIMKAQQARGARFDTGNIIQRAKSLIPLLVPLFVNSIRRADELAVAMEARCYQIGHPRTRLKTLRFEKRDYLGLLFTLVFLLLLLALRQWL